MPKATLPLVAALAAIFLLAACSKSSAPDPTPTPASGMSWQVDGQPVTASSTATVNQGTVVSVVGYGPANTVLGLEVPKAVGTYTFAPAVPASAYFNANSSYPVTPVYRAGDDGSGMVAGYGTIVVTDAAANLLAGTFTFTGIDRNTSASKTITAGTFRVGY